MSIWEVVPVTVKAGTEDDFEATFRSNIALLEQAEGCLDVKMLRAVDKQSAFLILIQWESVEFHTEVFTKSQAYAEFGRALGPFFTAPPEIFHAATVIDGFPNMRRATRREETL
jgi:heme-degrading monooxygenase HmoA